MPWLRKALYTVTGFTVGAMVTTCFLDTFWCGADVSVNWSPEEGLCNTFASKEVFRTDWIMNIITDLLSKWITFLETYEQLTNPQQSALCLFQSSTRFNLVAARFGVLLRRSH
jgi:hypothetical protein